MTFTDFIINYWYLGLEILWVLWTLFHTFVIFHWLHVKHYEKSRWYWHLKRVEHFGATRNAMSFLAVVLFVLGWLNIFVLILRFIF